MKSWSFVFVLTVGIILALGAAAFGNSGVPRRQFDPETLCENSSDFDECERRVDVCRTMHRSPAQRTRLYETFATCAQQLNITSLPDASEAAGNPRLYRNWMRQNPGDKSRLLNCAHQGLYNSDGTISRTSMQEKVNQLLEGQNEPELLQELTNKINTCPETQSRRQFFRCVYMGCATPQ